jgi:hypothetical protein
MLTFLNQHIMNKVNWATGWRKRMGIEPTPDAETGTGQRF